MKSHWMLFAALLLAGYAEASDGPLPEVKVPREFFACERDSDCAAAGDACRSCGRPTIINKKYLKAYDELDQKLRLEKGFVRACEACAPGRLKPRCVKKKCLQVPRAP